jgi:hypothetical protein
MSKTKMRCITCGKWFQSANAREVSCPECTQKMRKEKMATKNAPPAINKVSGNTSVQHSQNVQSNQSRPAVPPKPKPAKSGTNQWLDSLSDVKVGQPDAPVQRPKIPSAPQRPVRQERYPGSSGPGSYHNNQGPANNRPGGAMRGPAAYHPSNGASLSPTLGQRPLVQRQPQEGTYGRTPTVPGGRKPWSKNATPDGSKPNRPVKTGKPNRQPPQVKPKREKTPPPAPFVPNAEQTQQIEERYIALAQPAEFDGIRSQIATELNMPKSAVKKVIKELRERQHIPSWWEIQTYKGSNEEFEHIKTAYQPYLPVPPVGVHKLIADKLNLKSGDTYQAIKAIRIELNLPQYNDPQLHAGELRPQQIEEAEKLNSERAAMQSQTKEDVRPATEATASNE